ncbi:hypothetical protein [Natrinema thermotolerans]|uniref:hypothetical protein n=1 Tax=Natrinema thermotolerans TaxID=121872 RepID=UPI000B02AAED|nr:hypothetical protein [Natrinema thermotolerans]
MSSVQRFALLGIVGSLAFLWWSYEADSIWMAYGSGIPAGMSAVLLAAAVASNRGDDGE